MILFTEVLYDGDGRKTMKEKRKRLKTKEKIPCLVDLPSPLLRYGCRLFSGVRKQVGPTLSGGGDLIL